MDEGNVITTPRAQSIIIERPRLTKILDESEARIILLCAPAGYGKTTLARQWTERRDGVVWYSGGPAMADVAAFAAGLGAALAPPEAAEDAGARIERLAGGGQSPRGLARAVASAAGNRKLLVVDDYHHAVESEEVDGFIRELLQHTRFRLLLTTRVRPRWVGPRMSVYGEALVLGVGELAFDAREASAVLPEAPPVLANARGWPAVIGLAAMRSSSEGPIEQLDASELYDFFAEDLFGKIDALIQRGLFALALAGDLYTSEARALLRDDYEPVIREGAARGFIGRTPETVITIHPLLRTFLLAKLQEQGEEIVGELLGHVLTDLSNRRRWDACLAALERFPRTESIVETIELALRELLSAGRVATLKRWLELAHVVDAAHPVLLLLEAEIASREGAYDRARVLGARAGELLGGDDAAGGYVVAARAAHLQGDQTAARMYAARAKAIAESEERRQAALWAEFTTATEHDRDLAAQALEELRVITSGTAAGSFRLLTAEATLYYVSGDAHGAVAAADRALALLGHVDDAFLRTSALQISATVAIQVGRYADALDWTELMIQEGRSSGLDFVLDHALINQAAALIATRRFLQADRALREITRQRRSRDEHILANCELQRARLAIAVGDFERAATLLTRGLSQAAAPGTHEEYAAYRSLVAAVRAGDAKSDVAAPEGASRDFRFGPAAVVADLAQAIRGLAIGFPSSTESAVASLGDAVARGQIDTLVIACRAFPPLARIGAANEQLHESLAQALLASRDFDIGRQAGLEMARELRRNEPLSPREREVYEHLVKGRSNREIAKSLFISESTTKVHVRHIFEKLGVRSRAEAARVEIDDL